MLIFAHRGASGDYPENTILAFEKAIESGVEAIELDVHKSKDGHIVVIHDEDIKRTFKGKGLVKDYTLEELKSFKCRKLRFIDNDLCKIPTLIEVLDLLKDKNILLNIEAKTDEIHYDLEEDVLNLVRDYNMEDRVLISSFNHKCIDKFKRLDNNLKYAYLYWDDKNKDLPRLTNNLGNYSINISLKLVTRDIIKKAHNNNLKVYVYTVNSPDIMRKLAKLGVDGIFSDYPKLMKEALYIMS